MYKCFPETKAFQRLCAGIGDMNAQLQLLWSEHTLRSMETEHEALVARMSSCVLAGDPGQTQTPRSLHRAANQILRTTQLRYSFYYGGP